MIYSEVKYCLFYILFRKYLVFPILLSNGHWVNAKFISTSIQLVKNVKLYE